MLFRVSWDHLLSATSQQPALRSVFLGWEGIVNNEYNACHPEVDKDGRLEHKRRCLHSRRALYSFAGWGLTYPPIFHASVR